jgi:signal transduction histidine kinase
LARLEGGIETLKLEPVAIAELVQDVLSKFALTASTRGVQLIVTPHDPSIWVKADIGKLERVLCNLIDNALRYTAEGGAITVELARASCQSQVVIRVRDTGKGIAPEDIPFIFEPNFKGKQGGAADNATHLGLGLSIVRRLLELHHTVISVHSLLGSVVRCLAFPFLSAKRTSRLLESDHKVNSHGAVLRNGHLQTKYCRDLIGSI